MRPHPSRSRRTVLGALASALFLPALPALHAQTAYPSKPIRIVVPFPPGGSTDLLARRLGEKLATSLGQPVVVENRPGAGGTTGADYVAKSPPDGYTLLMGVTGSNAVAPSLYPKLPYDPVKDFAHISAVVSAPLVLSVNASSPIRSVQDYIAAARAKPISHGTPGNGTSMHLTAEMFALAAGVKLLHVPYKGTAPALNDMLGGNLESMFGDLLVLLPHIKGGKVRPLAVSSARRHPLLPEVPTMQEAGGAAFSDVEASSWQGLFAPAGTPADVVTRLNQATNKALESADIREFFGSQGFIVGGNSPEQFRAMVQSEVNKWARVVRAAQVKVD
jgi:tripartite-type tricarboxylate transporter receptor subunit TctC